MPDGKSIQRCLPKNKAELLTKSERKATVDKKIKGDKEGKECVGNTENAKVNN